MRFKLDEDFGSGTQQIFQAAGHDVHTVTQELLQGAADEALYTICCTEQRCLVPLDLDFSDVVRFPPECCGGIAVIRVSHNPSLPLLEQLIKALLSYVEPNQAIQQLLIIEVARIRVHQRRDETPNG
jgi:predicted nuclease of predicted toxin-antitoxin system